MNTQQKSQNVSVKNTEHNRGIKKIYDIYCLKCNSFQPNALEITETINSEPLNRFGCFVSLNNEIIPSLFDLYSSDSRNTICVSIDRGFFSPFNQFDFYRSYSYRLCYLKDKFSFLKDKIPICLLDVYDDKLLSNLIYRYVFFVKEVCNG